MNERIAEKKAVLALQCGLACRKPPPRVLGGSIQLTRQWVAARRRAMAVLRDKRSSRNQLSDALNIMLAFAAEADHEPAQH